MLNKLKLITNTVVHLKWIQVYYQIFYKIRNRVTDPISFGTLRGYKPVSSGLKLIEFSFHPASTSLQWLKSDDLKFTFLNVSHKFQGKINWNHKENGKLWTYNLNYFDFLFEEELDSKSGLKLIRDYCENFSGLQDGLEPYPISLRAINWVKYLSNENIRDADIDNCLFRQYKILEANLEFHILANHLLENAFSLFIGAYYFQNEQFYEKSRKLLSRQLNEQLLSDGAHYERSPMYHQILFFRLLDAINVVQNNKWKSSDFLKELLDAASLMSSWLSKISFRNGEIPYLKDATKGISPTTAELNDYSDLLGIGPTAAVPLSDSGYRKMSTDLLELIIDVGEVAPSYQPAHSHADELNFVLNIYGKPFIVDVGVSTYEKNQRRQLERSTISHNCVTIGQRNSSQVWGGFRVAKRAKSQVLKNADTEIEAEHTGFKKQGLILRRNISYDDKSIWIRDFLSVKSGMNGSLFSFLHFHPDVELRISGNLIFANDIILKCEGFRSLSIESYKYADGFNILKEAKKIVFRPTHITQIEIQYAN